MIPVRVYLKGFMSYRDEATLSFDGAPLWVLSGPNGAGKSAIFDAITFALYGTHRGGSQNAKDLINHRSDALEVEFDFLMEGEAYRVRRTVSSRGQTRETFVLRDTGPEPIPETSSVQGFKDWRDRVIGLEYDTFTSSVVLLQGQSEKLLDMKPGERHKALSELIDLAPYERLHRAAGARRAHHKSIAEHYGDQVQNAPVVSDEELSVAERKAKQTEEEWQRASGRRDILIELVGEAKSWESLSEELAERQGEAEKTEELLGREEEIRAGFGRLQEIRHALPTIESFVKDRARLSENEQEKAKAREKRRAIEGDRQEAAERKEAADSEVEKLAGLVEELKSSDASLAELVGKLKPVADHLDRLIEEQAELDGAKAKLDGLPQDVEHAVERAEEEAERLAQAEQALPWLKQLVRARVSLAKTILKDRKASEDLEALDPRLQRCEGECKRLLTEVEAAQKGRNDLDNRVARDQARCDDARKRRADFDDVSAQPTCGLCGQEITKEHAEQETARLDAHLAEVEADLGASKSLRDKAVSQLRALSEELREAQAEREGLLKEREAFRNEREQAGREARGLVEQAETSFNSMPIEYRSRIASEIPDGHEWTATVYPTDTELEDLTREVDGREGHAEHLRELRGQLEEKRRWDESCRSANQRLSKLLVSHSWDEARSAADDFAAHQDRRKELRMEIAEREEELREARETSAKLDDAVTSLNHDLQANKVEIESLRARRTEIERALGACLDRLPKNWRGPAESAEAEDLERWNKELDELAEYEGLASDVEHAKRSKAALVERIANLGVLLDKVPEEARRPAKEVEEELTAARDRVAEQDTERREAERHLEDLLRRRQEREELETHRRKAERQRGAYQTLHNLLGPSGVQALLLRAAEQDLVTLANETLDGLSRGRMRLKLRERGDQQKALDLEVLDGDTESNPVPVNLTSGSQRFRIAVSLALAIGRYKGQQARRIRSVIIDEGFGSLDKNSRDDMIRVLDDLQQALDRVILVSHQEEFATAFSNGYTVSRNHDSSEIVLLQPS